MNSPDEYTISLLRKGDISEFESIYHLYYPRLLRFCIGYLHDREISNEIVQNSFVKLWEERQKLSENTTIIAWLFVVIKNQCLNFIRDESRRKSYEVKGNSPYEDMRQLNYHTLQSFIPDELIDHELQEIIREAVDTLPEKCRRVFILSRFEDLSHKEISEQLNISKKTIENHITKALHILHLRLDPYLFFFL